MVGLGRLERPTSPLSGVRSNHLSYRPELIGRHGSRREGDPACPDEKEKRGRPGLSRKGSPDWASVFPLTRREERTNQTLRPARHPKAASLERR